MKIKIDETKLRQVIRRQLIAEAMEEDQFKALRNKPGQERELVTQDQFIDVMSKLSGKKWVTFGYLNGVEFNSNYTVKEKRPGDRVPKGYPNYDKIKSELGYEGDLQGIVKCTIMTINWQTSEEYGKGYESYRTAVNQARTDLNNKYGLEMPLVKNRETPQFAGDKNLGSNFELSTTPSSNSQFYAIQNVASPLNQSVVYYIIDKTGNIVGEEISRDKVAHMLKVSTVDGVAALRKLTDDENVVNEYIAAVKGLRHMPRRFKEDGFMFLCGTIVDENKGKRKFVYINENLSNDIKGVKIEPGVFHNLIMQRYSKSLSMLDNASESGQRNLDSAKAQQDFNNIYQTITPAKPNGDQAEAQALKETIWKVLREMNLL